jgi:hypothetical protein
MSPQDEEILVIFAALMVQVVYLFVSSRRGIRAVAGLMVALIAGLIANTVTGGFVNTQLASSLHIGLVVYSFTLGPVVEESAKFGFLILLLIPMNRRVKSLSESNLSFSSAQMGMLTGSFFMLFERLLKDLPGGFSFPLSLLDESPVHAVATGISSSAITSGSISRRFLLFFPAAVIIHASYNLLVALAVSSYVLYLLQTVVFLVFWIAFIVLGRHFRPDRKQDAQASGTKPTERRSQFHVKTFHGVILRKKHENKRQDSRHTTL